MSVRTLSPEMDAWLLGRQAAEARIQQAIEPFRDEHGKPEPRRTSPAWTHAVQLTDAEWAWLWRRFQGVSLPMIGFAVRIQRTGPEDVMKYSPEQRCWVLALAFKYRRKVFFNPKAGALDCAQFVHAIRQLAAKAEAKP